jgi:serine/threonine protein kinase
MGVVYEAFDHERGRKVALKTLLHFDPASLLRFKHEFRTLADLRHPNVVRLYELVATEDDIFFTMELLTGTDFLTHTRRREDTDASDPRLRFDAGKSVDDDETTIRDQESQKGQRLRGFFLGASSESEVSATESERASPADFGRLRSALIQLAQGVNALHVAGALHRDIKPSNVLVTPEGRVVLLDFGVATELAPRRDERRSEREMAGTVRYMAPEQATEDAPTAASDWYSVGVMLYEALVGRAPFVGPGPDVLTRKGMMDPPAPSLCARGIPSDLDELCCALLQPRPGARPTGTEVLRRLARARAARISSPPAFAHAARQVPLMAREAHLRTLRDAFDSSRAGRSVAVFVHGGPGMGKSALVQQFLDDLVAQGEAVTLRGRAYERETIPYKALDGVVDALSVHVKRLADSGEGVIVPDDAWALARLFPVFRRFALVAAMSEPPTVAPQLVRRRAVAALRALFVEVARRQPLVIYVDDVQWGDVDSVGLLLEAIRAPVPPILVVLTHREESSASPFLVGMHARWPSGAARDLAVGPLAFDDARALALALLDSDGDWALRCSDAIARDSGGNPFLVEELTAGVGRRAQAERASGLATESGSATLEQTIGRRLGRLPRATRLLVEIVAVAGRPLETSVAAEAAGVNLPRTEKLVATPRVGRFLRACLRNGREALEMRHDRIREVTVALLPPATLFSHHARLARVFEASPGADPEALAIHLLGAGQKENAGRHAERAAEQAAAKCAFDQAGRLYKLGLDTAKIGSEDEYRLRVRLAEALDGAGRGRDSAEVYMQALSGAPGAHERVDLQRRAAEQLIASGRIDDGVAMMRRVLEAVGLSMPRSATSALVWLLVYRVWLWIIGERVRERAPEEVRPVDAARIDACHAMGVTLGLANAVYASCFASRQLILALRGGDAARLLRALSLELLGVASRGGPETPKERALLKRVQELADRSTDRDAQQFVAAIRAGCLFLHGRWSELRGSGLALELDHAIAGNRTGWRYQALTFSLWTRVLVGDLGEIRDRVPLLIEDAERRGDVNMAVTMRVGYTNLAWLADDDVEEARRQLNAGVAAWSHRGFVMHHYRALLAEVNIELYEGNGSRAYDLVVRRWRPLVRSFVLFVQYIRADAHFLRARAALASVGAAPNRRARIAEAERHAKALDHERMPWTALLADLVWSGVREANGDREGTIARLRAAIDRADALGMALHAAAGRYRLGSLMGNATEGRELTARGESWMLAQSIRAPARMADMLVPMPPLGGTLGRRKP